MVTGVRVIKKFLIVLILGILGCQQGSPSDYKLALTEVEKSIKEVKPGTAFELALEKHKQLADKYPEHKPFYEMMVKTLIVQENVMED